jgi:hypothetical protein
MFIMGATCSRIVIQGLVFDTTDNTGTGESGVPQGISLNGTNIALINNTFINVSYAINGNLGPTAVLVQNNICPVQAALRAYFVWMQGSNWTVLGNTVAGSEDEHDIRGYCNNVLIADNTLANPPVNPGTQGKLCINLQQGQYLYVVNNVVQNTGGGVWIGPLQGQTQHNSINWVDIQNNDLGGFFQFNPGADDVLVANNVLRRANGQAGFDINGFDAGDNNRESSDLRIENNTEILQGSKGDFVALYSQCNGIIVENNLLVAPSLIYGNNTSAAIYVSGTTLSSFTLISNNIWPLTTLGSGVGYYYVTPSSGGPGYLTPAEWQASGVISGDTYLTVAVSQLQINDGFLMNGLVYGVN